MRAGVVFIVVIPRACGIGFQPVMIPACDDSLSTGWKPMPHEFYFFRYLIVVAPMANHYRNAFAFK